MALAVPAGVFRPTIRSRAGGAPDVPRSQIWGSSRSLRSAASAGSHANVAAARPLRAPMGGAPSASLIDWLAGIFNSKSAAADEQVMALYEINEGDRSSPANLQLRKEGRTGIVCLGDLVPYSNKVYGPSGKNYLGISAGLCTVIEAGGPKLIRYETTYTHYVGDYGQISGMGPYFINGDSEMVITGGTGIFKGARGIVKIHNIKGPLKLIYTYYVSGIEKLPPELSMPAVLLEENAGKKSVAEQVPVKSSA